jgi:hypothetical protein
MFVNYVVQILSDYSMHYGENVLVTSGTPIICLLADLRTFHMTLTLCCFIHSVFLALLYLCVQYSCVFYLSKLQLNTLYCFLSIRYHGFVSFSIAHLFPF